VKNCQFIIIIIIIISSSSSMVNKTVRLARDLADCLIFFIDVIVAGKQEPAIATGTFTSAMITTNYHQVQRVTDSLQVVFLELIHNTAI